jgi:hypothetical protein
MTPLAELQFDFGRMLSYVPYLMKAEDRLYSLRNQMRTADESIGSLRVPTDEIFISHVVLRSPLAFYTTNEAKKLAVDLSAMNDIDTYEHTYFEVNGIEVQKDSQEITIFMWPPRLSPEGRMAMLWAVQSAMNTLCYFGPGIAHSWVHFLFPDAVAATVHNDVPRNSVLYRLLEPHTHYTSRINWEALG